MDHDAVLTYARDLRRALEERVRGYSQALATYDEKTHDRFDVAADFLRVVQKHDQQYDQERDDALERYRDTVR